MLYKKRGQVWIETVTYTLIAFVLIGLVIGFARPKVEEIQDQSIIEQSIKIMRGLDSQIQEISEKGDGNKRKLEMTIRKGDLFIDAPNDTLRFVIEGRFMYSQPGQSYIEGGLNITTIQNGKVYTVTLEKKYEDFNLLYNGKEEMKRLPRSSTAYELFLLNNDSRIDFELD